MTPYKEQKVCPVCNTEFTVTGSTRNKKFCSKKCADDSMKSLCYDINNPPTCAFCNKTLTHRQIVTGYKYCSYRCFTSYKKQKFQKKVSNSFCQICGKSLSESQVKSGNITCSPKCACLFRMKKYGTAKNYTDTDIDRRRNALKERWQDSSFRESVVSRMKNNNPSKSETVQNKIKETKIKNNTLHVWSGERGGNGKVSKAEKLLMDFCLSHGFLYNKAINTHDARVRYPDNKYANCYKPDFVNVELGLCVEIDGDSHKTKDGILKDKKKEECLCFLGYKTIRFTNDCVINDIESVISSILSEMEMIKFGKTSI